MNVKLTYALVLTTYLPTSFKIDRITKVVYTRARTTCRVGVGSAGRFWQRPGLVGSGNETEVGLPLSYLQFLHLWVKI